ncbi:M20/M25/M40 family metallo-hydrolase [Candidatus Vidania fulgoroideorum]
MLEKLVKILKFNSENPDNSNCQKYIGNLFKKIGFQIFILKYKGIYNSIFVNYKNKKKKKIDIAFLGHTDVVPFKKKNIFIKNKKIFSRGIVDMKGSIYCFYKAVQFLLKKKKKNIAILLSGDEEGKTKFGIKELIKRLKNKIKIKNCIIGEPTSIKKVCDTMKTRRRGSLNFKIILKSKRKHNAYYNNKTFNRLNSLLLFFNKKKINMFNIKTNNEKTNIIPSKTVIFLNYRYKKKKNISYIFENIKKILLLKKIKNYIKVIQNSSPYKSKEKKFCKLILNIFKKKINIKNTGGTSDGRYLKKISKNIIELGFKNKYAHRDNENVYFFEIYNLMLIYFKIINY